MTKALIPACICCQWTRLGAEPADRRQILSTVAENQFRCEHNNKVSLYRHFASPTCSQCWAYLEQMNHRWPYYYSVFIKIPRIFMVGLTWEDRSEWKRLVELLETLKRHSHAWHSGGKYKPGWVSGSFTTCRSTVYSLTTRPSRSKHEGLDLIPYFR